MAQIQMTEALSAALDLLLDSANAQIAELLADVRRKDDLTAALMERIRRSEAEMEDMKRALDEKRAQVMGAADTVKKRQAAHGTNAHPK
jgi:hypothetical protein